MKYICLQSNSWESVLQQAHFIRSDLYFQGYWCLLPVCVLTKVPTPFREQLACVCKPVGIFHSKHGQFASEKSNYKEVSTNQLGNTHFSLTDLQACMTEDSVVCGKQWLQFLSVVCYSNTLLATENLQPKTTCSLLMTCCI